MRRVAGEAPECWCVGVNEELMGVRGLLEKPVGLL